MGIPDAAPVRLGRYELVARLATGGMGEIFLARLEGAAGFEKLFVIKRILPHLADDMRFRGMLIAEARIASVLAHANICQVYELGETDGQLYIVMEYLEGITALPLLHRRSKERRPLDLGFVVGVIQQAIDGLHYAHELKDRTGDYLGIVHRDVTPSNIFLTDAGIVKILDFGIAKVKDASAHTQTGTVKGKYAYMAPEQLRGGELDRRADVFALGIVLFEMLALRRLFQRKTDYLTFHAVIEQPIPDVRNYRPDCPPAVAEAVARALDRDPANRFATARQFGSAVLDAAAMVQRPWTQSEVGDFVVANFADDIQKRGAQIARAVGFAGPPQAMPALIDPDHGLDVETDDEFPPVDSTMSDGHAPTMVSMQSPMAASRIEVPASGPRTQPPADGEFVPRSSPSVVVVRRSWLWPFLAFAMVAVAGGALFLVWRTPQQTIFITSSSDSRITARGSDTLVVGPKQIEPVPPPLDAGTKPEPVPRRNPARPPAGPQDRDYERILADRNIAASRCLSTADQIPANATLAIKIDRDGRGVVSIAPDSLAVQPVGACIKSVYAAAKFPRGKGFERQYVLDARELGQQTTGNTTVP